MPVYTVIVTNPLEKFTNEKHDPPRSHLYLFTSICVPYSPSDSGINESSRTVSGIPEKKKNGSRMLQLINLNSVL